MTLTLSKLFPCMEVGSLPKLPGRASKLQGKEPTERERTQLYEVLALLSHDPDLIALSEDFLAAEGKAAIVAANSRFYMRMLEVLGLKYIFDGEAHRPEMYEGVVAHVHGMERLDPQVSFVNVDGHPNIFVPYSYHGPLSIDSPLHLDEVRFVQTHSRGEVKVPVIGAYTLGTWSDLGEGPQRLRLQGVPLSEARRRTVEELVLQFADNVINPTLKALAAQGITRIQIDEPSASVYEGQAELLYEATRRSIAGVRGVELGMHLCFSRDYGSIAGLASIPELRFLTLEIANRDTPDHGAYTDVIHAFQNAGYKGKYCVGVVNVHTNEVESPQLIAERLCHVAGMVGAERVEAAPDCGLRTRSLPIAVQKLQNLVEGARLAREQYQR